MKWFRVDVGRHSHRKMKRLARILGVSRFHVVGWHDVLLSMVTEAGRVDGSLDGITSEDIAIEMEFEGAPEKLLEAFIDCELIDQRRGGKLFVHDFEERAGSAKEAKRKKKYRDTHRARRVAVPGHERDKDGTVHARTYVRTDGRTNEQTDGQKESADDVRDAPQDDVAKDVTVPVVAPTEAKKKRRLPIDADPALVARAEETIVAWNEITVDTRLPSADAFGGDLVARDKNLLARLRGKANRTRSWWRFVIAFIASDPRQNGASGTWKTYFHWLVANEQNLREKFNEAKAAARDLPKVPTSANGRVSQEELLMQQALEELRRETNGASHDATAPPDPPDSSGSWPIAKRSAAPYVRGRA